MYRLVLAKTLPSEHSNQLLTFYKLTISLKSSQFGAMPFPRWAAAGWHHIFCYFISRDNLVGGGRTLIMLALPRTRTRYDDDGLFNYAFYS